MLLILDCVLLHHGFVAASMQDYPDMHADKPYVTCKVLPPTCCDAVNYHYKEPRDEEQEAKLYGKVLPLALYPLAHHWFTNA